MQSIYHLGNIKSGWSSCMPPPLRGTWSPIYSGKMSIHLLHLTIGQRATVGVPGQRGASLLYQCFQQDPPWTAALHTGNCPIRYGAHFWMTSKEGSSRGKGHMRQNVQTSVIVWDEVAFHHARALRAVWSPSPMMSLFLPPYTSP